MVLVFQRSVNHVFDTKGNQSLISEVINENLETKCCHLVDKFEGVKASYLSNINIGDTYVVHINDNQSHALIITSMIMIVNNNITINRIF